MKTTSLYVDILIIGFMPIVWIVIFAMAFEHDFDWVDFLIYDYKALGLMFLIIVAYVFGLIFDYINAWVIQVFRTKSDGGVSGISVVELLYKSKDIQEFLDNHFSRLRIMRGVVVHSLVIGFAIIVYRYNQSWDFERFWKEGLMIFSGVVIFFLMSLFSYKRRHKVYLNYLSEAKRLLIENEIR